MILTGIAALLGLIALVNLARLRGVTGETVLGKVSILIPARNEEFTLPGCLLSAVFTSAAEILVYDDASEDGTARVAWSATARYDKIRMIEGGSLPTGWIGKANACQKLADAATGDWLLFLDAGARISSMGVERLLAQAEKDRLTWLNCRAESRTVTLAEKLILPALDFAVYGFLPGMPAQGPCTLVHRATYEMLGGHATFAGEIGADLLLAREWRRRGERAVIFDGRGVVTMGVAANFHDLKASFRRHFYLAFPGAATFIAFAAAMAAISFTPWWPALLIILLVRVVFAIRLRQPVWSALAYPLAMVWLLAAAVSSWRTARSREGVEWRGRRYRIE